MVDQVLPHQSHNLIALIVSFLAFVWGWGAFGRFWAVLHYRYAVLTENTVMLRGLGGHLEHFTSTMPSHSRSILHTRNSTVAQDVKFMYLPFFIYNMLKSSEGRKVQGNEMHENISTDSQANGRKSSPDSKRDEYDHRLSIPVIETASKSNENDSKRVTFDFDNSGPNGFLNASFYPHASSAHQIIPKQHTRLCGHVPVWCATQSTILVLYGLKLDILKRFFRYSIKANKLFMKGTKYRDKPSKSEAKSKKSKRKKRSSDKEIADSRHIYAERLIALFTKKEMCMAYSTIDSNDQNESFSSGDRLYNVPIYDTPRDVPFRNLDSTDIAVHSSTQMDEVDLTMAGEHANEVLNAIEQAGGGGYHRVHTSRENRSEGSRSPSRFSRVLNNAISSRGRSEQRAGQTGQDTLSVGILIIPRDLPCTGTPENISNSTTATSVSAANSTRDSPDVEGDIELGTRSNNTRQSSVDGSPVDRSKYTALDFGLQILHPKSPDEESEVASIEYGDLFVHAGGSLFTSSDIYGLPGGGSSGVAASNGESNEHEGSTECVICLTEMQDIFLLPCRHLCVCKECFPHIDKCPVCRAPFDDYVTLRHENLVTLKAPKCTNNAPVDGDEVHLTTDNGKLKTL